MPLAYPLRCALKLFLRGIYGPLTDEVRISFALLTIDDSSISAVFLLRAALPASHTKLGGVKSLAQKGPMKEVSG